MSLVHFQPPSPLRLCLPNPPSVDDARAGEVFVAVAAVAVPPQVGGARTSPYCCTLALL